jgi:hypothetical protein
MLRLVLFIVLAIFIARAFWRVFDGIEGSGARSQRADGARSRLRHVRAAGSRRDARRRAGAAALLL